MAEGLGTGLQNLLQQFESAWHLQTKEFAQASSFVFSWESHDMECHFYHGSVYKK